MPIKGLIFDKDGTLFDFQATWSAWARKVIEKETDGDEQKRTDLAKVLGFDLIRDQFLPDSPVIAETAEVITDLAHSILSHEDKTTLHQRLVGLASQVPQVPVTPLAALFERFAAAGHKLGIATNDAEAAARAHLTAAGVLNTFDFIAGYDTGFGGKPLPGQLLAFCDQTGLQASACAMVGDSLHDLEAGRAAGMVTVGVLTGPATRETLAPVADVVLQSIAELPDWLKSQR